MAVDIGPKIGIDGEAEYRREINQIITQAKTLSSEMKKVESSFGKEASAQNKAAEKAKVLNKQIETQGKRVEKLTAMYQKSVEAKGEDAAESLKWAQAVNNAQADLNKLEQDLKSLPNNLEITGQAFQESGKKIQAAGDAMSAAGTKMTSMLTAPLVALGGAAVKIASDFDTQMSKVMAISGATTSEIETLAETARDFGENTKFSATEVGQAYEYMAMAGWKTEDMLEGVSGLLDLAAASGEDLASVSDIVTDALTGFRMSAEDSQHFADVLAAASSNANTNVAMMGETFKYVAPVAGALSYSVEDIALATGLMANSGIKASQAGTSLRSILSRMASPAKETAEAMESLGVSLTDEKGNMKSMREVMDDLRKGFSGLSETQKTQAATALAGKNAMSGLLSIVNASEEDYTKLANAIDGADGAAKSMAETMQDNLAGRMTELKSKAEELAIGFGEALMPTAEELVSTVGDLVDWLNSLSDEERDQIIKIAGITAAAGPALSAAGKMTKGVGQLVEGAGKLTEKIGGAVKDGSGLTKLLGTAGPVVAGIAVSAAAAAAAYEAWKGSSSGLASAVQKNADAVADVHNKNVLAVSSMEDLAARVDELSAKDQLSAEEKLELAAAVEQLNSVMPDLNLTIDENTGNLDENSKAILDNIDASLKQYKVEKNKEELAEITEKYAENEEKLAAIQKERAELEKRIANSGQYGDSLDDLQNRLNNANEAEQTVIATQKDLANQYDTLVDVNADLTGSKEASAEATKSEQQAIDDLATATSEDVDEIATAQQELAEAYQQAYDSAYQSLTSQQGLFDEVKEAATASATEMATNLGAQSEAYANYANNLVEATRLANESSNPYFAGIVQSIADMGMDGAGYLQELINAANTDSGELDAILSNYGNMEANKQKLATVLAEISTGSSLSLDGLTTSIQTESAEAATAAASIPENIAAGITSGAGNLSSATGDVEAQATTDLAEAVQTQGSALNKAGQNAAGQLASGLRTGNLEVFRAAQDLGKMAGTGAGAAASYRAQFVQTGRYLAEGFAIGMESQLSRIQQAAAQMAAAADAAVRAKGKISSPSKVMIENGQYIGEGFALGILNMIPQVSRAGSLMAGAALYSASPSAISGVNGGAAGGTNYDYGGFNITVNGAQGQDVNALADAVSRKINGAMRSRRAVFA